MYAKITCLSATEIIYDKPFKNIPEQSLKIDIDIGYLMEANLSSRIGSNFKAHLGARD